MFYFVNLFLTTDIYLFIDSCLQFAVGFLYIYILEINLSRLYLWVGLDLHHLCYPLLVSKYQPVQQLCLYHHR